METKRFKELWADADSVEADFFCVRSTPPRPGQTLVRIIADPPDEEKLWGIYYPEEDRWMGAVNHRSFRAEVGSRKMMLERIVPWLSDKDGYAAPFQLEGIPPRPEPQEPAKMTDADFEQRLKAIADLAKKQREGGYTTESDAAQSLVLIDTLARLLIES